MKLNNIRIVTEKDVDQILDWILKMPDWDQVRMEEIERDFFYTKSKKTATVFGYHHDGRIVGFIRVMKFTEDTNISPDAGKLIAMLYVDPAHQGMGIGSSLLQYVFDTYHNNDMYLNVDNNNQNAIKLYRKMGFHVSRRFPTFCRMKRDCTVNGRML